MLSVGVESQFTRYGQLVAIKNVERLQNGIWRTLE